MVLAADALHRHVVAVPAVLGLGAADARARRDLEYEGQQRRGVGDDRDGEELEDAPYVLEPRVRRARREAAEGFAVGEVGDHIEGGEVVPSDEVGRLAALRGFVEALDEEVDVLDRQWLLLAERAVGEGRVHGAAHPRVVSQGRGNDLLRTEAAAPHRDLGDLGMTMSVDIFPGLRRRVAKEVRAGAEDIAVLVVQIAELEVQISLD